MLETIFGSAVREQVLLYILAMGEGYPREMARFFGSGLDSVQKQLTRLEKGGVLKNRRIGRTLLYTFDDSCRFICELSDLLEVALASTSGAWADELRASLSELRERHHAKSRYRRREYRRGP